MKKEGVFQRITYRFHRKKIRYQMKKQQKEQEQSSVKVHEKIKEFGENIVDVKPKREEDYCTVLGIRMGRKLVLWGIAIVALLSLGNNYLSN